MLNLNLRRNRKQQPEVIQFMEVGDLVRRNEDGAVGILRTIDLSPYWVEEIEGVERAYVEFKLEDGTTAADWILPEELTVLAKASLVAVAS
jgi:hypothetical protein